MIKRGGDIKKKKKKKKKVSDGQQKSTLRARQAAERSTEERTAAGNKSSARLCTVRGDLSVQRDRDVHDLRAQCRPARDRREWEVSALSEI